jgi:spectinomycin phosphotransferase
MPVDVTATDLIVCLRANWGLDIAAVEYVAVGGGSHHWVAHEAAARRHWVTVDDLEHKPFLGDTRASTLGGLRSAFETARTLREAGLEFVVAPSQSIRGEVLESLGMRYAVTVFPFLNGSSGRFGEPLPASERLQLVDMLVQLHQATPSIAASVVRPTHVVVPMRAELENALDRLDRPWEGGPFSEPARAVFAGRRTDIRRLLATFDRLATQVAAAEMDQVITHGEPHSANIMRACGRLFLIDWDTVALGPPERDLWLLATETGAELERYARATGRQIKQEAIRLYRLRWLLDDISYLVCLFTSAHDHTADTEHAWKNLPRVLGSPDLA